MVPARYAGTPQGIRSTVRASARKQQQHKPRRRGARTCRLRPRLASGTSSGGGLSAARRCRPANPAPVRQRPGGHHRRPAALSQTVAATDGHTRHYRGALTDFCRRPRVNTWVIRLDIGLRIRRSIRRRQNLFGELIGAGVLRRQSMSSTGAQVLAFSRI